MDRDVQAGVDRLLLDFGEYLPLEYLLQEARLDYADFEAWRRGELEYLEDALFGDPGRIREALTEAERYLARLGWQAEPVDYSAHRSDDEPVLLQRHAIACERLRDHASGADSWFRLCWNFPERASWLDGSSDRALREDWEAFQDLDLALPAEAFPAWRLMRRPGLVKRHAPARDDAGPPSFRLVRQLCRHHVGQSQPGDRDVITLRSELQTADPALFAHCLALLARP